MNVDYKELYFCVQRQNGDLSLMVDKYQNEIIPQYEKLLEMARAERDAVMNDLKRITGCHSCKHHLEDCNYRACMDDDSLWEWQGPQEVTK